MAVLREIQQTQQGVEQRLEKLANSNTHILASLHAAERIHLQRMQIDTNGRDVDAWCRVRGNVELDDLVDPGEDMIFMIESSPKQTLSSREGCALESAARNSELGVVMVRVGRMLDLRDNTTCQLYTRSQPRRTSPLSVQRLSSH